MSAHDDWTRPHQGFLRWMDDEPDQEIEIAAPQPGDSPVKVLFFVDDEDEELEPTTYIATAGLSARSFDWAPGGAELLLCVTGDFEPEELEPLGQLLGHLALALRTVETPPVPGLLLEVGPLPIFEGMTCLLLTQWDQGEGGLLETDPPVRLLSVNPLYEEEAIEVVKLSEEEALLWFDERGVDIDDPYRDSVFASEFAAASEQTLAALNSQSSFEIASAIQQMSGSMASWLSAAAPGFFEQFGQGDGKEKKLEAVFSGLGPRPVGAATAGLAHPLARLPQPTLRLLAARLLFPLDQGADHPRRALHRRQRAAGRLAGPEGAREALRLRLEHGLRPRQPRLPRPALREHVQRQARQRGERRGRRWRRLRRPREGPRRRRRRRRSLGLGLRHRRHPGGRRRRLAACHKAPQRQHPPGPRGSHLGSRFSASRST
jgi:hypothetical protein